MKIERNNYVNWLRKWRDQQIIKVVSGVRRCGKSTLFELYKEWLLSTGVTDSQIISINFESIEYDEMRDYHKLYNFISSQINKGEKKYIFLDEIQHVPQYERAVDSLFIRPECDIYITGSNAYFMSGELATLLAGRYVELRMLPLSFAEFYSGFKDNNAENENSVFRKFLQIGGMPYLTHYALSDNETGDYLRSIYNTVILKDVIARLNVSDVATLENITKFLLSNTGSIISTSKITNSLKSVGKSVDQKTVDKYLQGLTDSLLLYKVPRYNLKGKMLLKTSPKYYIVDTGLRNALIKTESADIGHLIENVVYLELCRRGYDVYVGEASEREIDFVCIKGDEKIYIQVAYLLADERIIDREFGAFDRVKDQYPKYVISMDELDMSRNGIKHCNLVKWLLST